MIHFIDKLGNIALQLDNFNEAGNFSEGLAPVLHSQYFFGFIDKSGELAIETPFLEGRNFSDGLAIVKTRQKGFYEHTETKWGAIDKTGRIVFETDFDKLYDFSEGIALAVKGNELFLVNREGNIIYSFKKNKIQLEFRGNQKFSEGLIVAVDEETGECGFINKTGEFVIKPQFEDAANFSEGLARVSVKENHIEYLGFINTKGEYVIEPTFDIDNDFLRCSNDFSEGLASLLEGPLMMNKDSNFMFINKSGEIVLHTKFFRAEDFHQGLAVVWDEHSDKCGYIDKSGKLAIPLMFSRANDFSEGLAQISF